MANSKTPYANAAAEFERSDAERHQVCVSYFHYHPMNNWREAILYYLFGVWGEKEMVMQVPEISFGGVTLSLNRHKRTYRVYGISPESTIETMCEHGGKMITVGAGQDEVEMGLIRFVKNDSVGLFSIGLPGGGSFRLWKTKRRGEYRCQATGIPLTP